MKLLAALLAFFRPSPQPPPASSTPSPSAAPPAFVEITLEQSGDVLYKEAPDDQQPLKFKLAEADTKQILNSSPSSTISNANSSLASRSPKWATKPTAGKTAPQRTK